MSATYAEQLQALYAAATGGDKTAALAVIDTPRAEAFPPEKRLNVYSYAYFSRLREAVLSDYPAWRHYKGKDEAERLAGAFVRDTPSRYRDLNLYSYPFPDYLAAKENDAAATDIARLESAVAEIFRMPESPALTAQRFAALGEEALDGYTPSLRAASRLMTFSYDANGYVSAFRDNPDGAPAALADATASYLCVVRHENTVRRLPLEPAAYRLLYAFTQGAPFGDAVAAEADITGEEALAAALPLYVSLWLENGVFRDIG